MIAISKIRGVLISIKGKGVAVKNIAIMELGYQCSCFHRRILFSIMKMEISEADNNTGEVSRLGSGLAGITNPKKCMTYA